jgi:hypothetical protein
LSASKAGFMNVSNLWSRKYTSLNRKTSLHEERQEDILIHEHAWNVIQK